VALQGTRLESVPQFQLGYGSDSEKLKKLPPLCTMAAPRLGEVKGSQTRGTLLLPTPTCVSRGAGRAWPWLSRKAVPLMGERASSNQAGKTPWWWPLNR